MNLKSAVGKCNNSFQISPQWQPKRGPKWDDGVSYWCFQHAHQHFSELLGCSM